MKSIGTDACVILKTDTDVCVMLTFQHYINSELIKHKDYTAITFCNGLDFDSTKMLQYGDGVKSHKLR